MLTQKALHARASIARDLYREGKIDGAEFDRLFTDAVRGIDTGPVKYLPEREWKRARLAAAVLRHGPRIPPI